MFTDYSSELKQFKTNAGLTQFYSLPDGQTVDISSEMISTAEPLFNPEALLGADDTVASQLPMHKLVNNAFRRLDSALLRLSNFAMFCSFYGFYNNKLIKNNNQRLDIQSVRSET